MLHCDLCDYYKTANTKGQGAGKCMCELTGFVFHKNVEEYDLENHPCFDYEVKTIATKQDYSIKISA
ncbi:hypothetical protein HMPREF1982_01109 [Clostridiales bacterium oral taxon 876 str. F0540]|nr:hypothetical protein HMPREF1982_01109 [Clostridiales bacterium oral taxon 876 str. F0540]